MHYFDWTATTPMSKEALIEYTSTAETFYGNPSSLHPVGQNSKTYLEECRNRISEILHTKPSYVYFTSGGTESNSIVLNSLIRSPNPGEIITTAIEHAAILEHKSTLESLGWTFTTLKCPNGYLDVNSLKEALNEKTRMVCIMAVNNVVGTIQPLQEAINTIRNYSEKTKRKIHIHTDAVQALGKIEVDLSKLDVDSASFSSHKFYGPRGIGILFNKNQSLQSLSKGGGQELGLRPGTENLPAIAAMTKALTLAEKDRASNYSIVMNYHNQVMAKCLELNYDIISPKEGLFSPYILTIALRTAPAEVFLRLMSDKGFCMSAGSACSSSTRSKTEGVLAAMNISPELRRGAIRISFSPKNTQQEIDLLLTTLKELKEALR